MLQTMKESIRAFKIVALVICSLFLIGASAPGLSIDEKVALFAEDFVEELMDVEARIMFIDIQERDGVTTYWYNVFFPHKEEDLVDGFGYYGFKRFQMYVSVKDGELLTATHSEIVWVIKYKDRLDRRML